MFAFQVYYSPLIHDPTINCHPGVLQAQPGVQSACICWWACLSQEKVIMYINVSNNNFIFVGLMTTGKGNGKQSSALSAFWLFWQNRLYQRIFMEIRFVFLTIHPTYNKISVWLIIQPYLMNLSVVSLIPRKVINCYKNPNYSLRCDLVLYTI